MKAQLDTMLEAGVARGAVPGAVAVIVDRHGVRYEGSAGERALGSGVEMTTDTVGALYSMTKAVTGAAAMQLVERGLLDLDAPAGTICPELAEVSVLEGFDGLGRPKTRPPATPVTLRQLLTHTSGFVYEVWNQDSQRWHEATGTPGLGSRERAALREPLMFDPGTRWHYGIGLDWVGQMVEVVAETTLGQYFEQHLTGPLGMVDTAFSPTPSMVERLSAMHSRDPGGPLAVTEIRQPKNPQFELGGGGLYGTMGDYGRFVRMMLNDGELDGTRVLDADTVALMCRNHIGDLAVEPLRSCAPHYSNDAEFFPDQRKGWGLSFLINEEPGPTGRPPGTLMWGGLANSYYWIDRRNGIGGSYMSQVLPFADEPSLGLFYELERAVYEDLSH